MIRISEHGLDAGSLREQVSTLSKLEVTEVAETSSPFPLDLHLYQRYR